MDFLELRWDSRVTTGNSGFLFNWPREVQFSYELRVRTGDCSRDTAGPNRPHLGLCRGEAKDSALPLSRDPDLLEPPERPQGSPAPSSVWREDPGLLSRPCRNRRPSARKDGGVSGVSSSCGKTSADEWGPGGVTRWMICSRAVSLTRLGCDGPRGRNVSSCTCCILQESSTTKLSEWLTTWGDVPTLGKEVWSACQGPWSSKTPEVSHNQ